MLSIADVQSKNLGTRQPLTEYHHVLRVDSHEVEEMTREQLIEIVLEQHAFILLLLSIVYNVKSEATTRLAAVDLVVQAVRRNVRGVIDEVTDAMSVTFKAGNAGSVADRLGFHENCVGQCYKDLEEYGAIIKSSHKGELRTDPRTGKQYRPNLLEVSIRPVFLADPTIVEGKKARMKPEPKLVVEEEAPTQENGFAFPPECPNCKGHTFFAVCDTCFHDALHESGMEVAHRVQAEQNYHHDEIAQDEIGQVIEGTCVIGREDKELASLIPVRPYLNLEDKEQLKQFATLIKKHSPKAGTGHVIVPGSRNGHLLPPREIFDVLAGRLCSPLEEDKQWAREEIVKRFEIWQR